MAVAASLLNVGLKSSRKLLVILCLVSLIALLLTHRESIIRGISPGQWDAKRSDFRALISLSEKRANKKPEEEAEDPFVANKKPEEEAEDPFVANKKPEEEAEDAAVASVEVPSSDTSSPSSRPTSKPSHRSTRRSGATTRMKARGTTFSFLGNTYAEDETHVHSKCPNRTREKLSRGFFKFMYKELVPVLQWKKHAQESEYARLRKYGGTYGWMDVSWDVVKETLSLLNSTGNGYMFDTWDHRSPCIRCAVVGNAGILNGSRMGKEIDAHDYVFRVNGAILKGFEKDVGNKTSFYFFSTNTLFNSLGTYHSSGFKRVPHTKETRYLLLPDHNRDYFLVRAALQRSRITEGYDKGIDPTKFFGANLTTEHFKILHPDFMRYLRNKFLWDPILKTTMREIYRPSTGASMLLAAIHTCDQVDAYGFMTPNYRKFSDHYFDSSYKRVVFYINHSFRREMHLWQELHKAGVINLFMRD
ncbi:alpha-N-acetylgalactosaminide alpha-2,6-sialyltransferase 2-like [Gastrophryne carolinensis]